MQNIFNNINKIGIRIIPDVILKPTSADTLSTKILILLAALTSILSAGFTSGGIWLINELNNKFYFPFYFPLVATIIWFLLYKFLPEIYSFIGISIAIISGAPFALETGGFFFSKTLAAKLTKKDTLLLYHCGVCGVIAAAFGAPLAALCFALEICLLEWSFIPITALLIASLAGGGVYWLVHGTDPAFKISISKNVFTWNIYAVIGLIIGMWAALTVNLTRVTSKGIKYLTSKHYLWLLIPVAIITFTFYYSPSRINNTYGSLDALLNARVTLVILFFMAFLKWFSWILYNSFFRTGTGIIPLAISGGALALIFGFILQLIFSHLKIDVSIIVLIGMAAMIAGTSRALITTVVFMLEVTHAWEITFPVLLTTVVSYVISYLLIRTKRLYQM